MIYMLLMHFFTYLACGISISINFSNVTEMNCPGFNIKIYTD